MLWPLVVLGYPVSATFPGTQNDLTLTPSMILHMRSASFLLVHALPVPFAHKSRIKPDGL